MKYQKVTISLREDIIEKIKMVMEANAIDRSAAVSMMLQRAPLNSMLPPDYLTKLEERLAKLEQMNKPEEEPGGGQG